MAGPRTWEPCSTSANAGAPADGNSPTADAYCDLAGLRAILALADAPGMRQVVLRHPSESLATMLRVLGWDAGPGLRLDGPGG